ncbi:MAG: SGNH/GDSL hydrolase family protein [Planctomycetes bacterium]|nr:SGNH/GDSL hydrolase family protein [Planctomycetota bacterium]
MLTVFITIESAVFIYFLYLTYLGDAFFLIGNQRILDFLIKSRLIYSVYYAQSKKGFVYRADPDLGYTLGKDKDVGLIKTNNDGMRSDREYSLLPGPDTLRIAVFGDSFVFGDGENNQSTWPYFLERQVKNIEVMNFGVSGYGLGQSYLRYLKDGIKFQPDIIMFSYLWVGERDRLEPREISSRNLRMADFYRVQFQLEEEKLVTEVVTPYDLFNEKFRAKYVYNYLPNFRGRELFLHNQLFSATNTGLLIKMKTIKHHASQALTTVDEDAQQSLLFKMLDNILRSAVHYKSQVIFLVPASLPVSDLFNNYDANVVFCFDAHSMLTKEIKNRGIASTIYNTTNHFNASGNKLYAEVVFYFLKSRAWGSGNRVFQYDSDMNYFVRKPTQESVK